MVGLGIGVDHQRAVMLEMGLGDAGVMNDREEVVNDGREGHMPMDLRLRFARIGLHFLVDQVIRVEEGLGGWSVEVERPREASGWCGTVTACA